MKRIIIDIYDKTNGHLDGLIEIKSEEYGFIHSSDKTGRGMQCKYEGGTNEYAKLCFRLDRLADLIRKIELSGK